MKNQYRVDDLVTLVNIDGKWWAISKDIGDYIGYKRASVAFNKFCTEEEVIVESVQYKDQKRATQLVSRVGIYELLEKTSLDIDDEKVKWICEKLIRTMKAMNGESCPGEIEVSKIECKEKNKKKDINKLEMLKENSLLRNQLKKYDKDKKRYLRDIENRNIRIREQKEDYEQLEETVRHKDYKIEDRERRVAELKHELKTASKNIADLDIELIYVNDLKEDLENRIDSLADENDNLSKIEDELREELEKIKTKLKNTLERLEDREATLLSHYQKIFSLEIDKKESENDFEKRKELLESKIKILEDEKCPVCNLKSRIKRAR